MRVRWTTDASGDLARIVQRIREDHPGAALRAARKIYGGIELLRRFPHRGRLGLAPGTREIVYAPLPYVAVYEIVGDQIVILRIRHTSQLWP
jgi:addiction module RelE/StbE family toxin